jgi:hypothetical protein
MHWDINSREIWAFLHTIRSNNNCSDKWTCWLKTILKSDKQPAIADAEDFLEAAAVRRQECVNCVENLAYVSSVRRYIKVSNRMFLTVNAVYRKTVISGAAGRKMLSMSRQRKSNTSHVTSTVYAGCTCGLHVALNVDVLDRVAFDGYHCNNTSDAAAYVQYRQIDRGFNALIHLIHHLSKPGLSLARSR